VDRERARELLAAERARIERALAGRAHVDDGEPGDDEDPANLASDLYADELDEGLRDDLLAQLAAVDRAEARLADGTFGLSVASGAPIPDARLEILPTAELTVEEEHALERGVLPADRSADE
jgi:DnaK suppressor protein